jgi:glyoxylase-like metal-dependent hydrolase (beta-lactamase superfamily II)/rhodanese-related sulfurtransferase
LVVDLLATLQETSFALSAHVRSSAEEYLGGPVAAIDRAELSERIRRRDLEVVGYCRGRFCALASQAMGILQAAGRKARRLEGGRAGVAAGGTGAEGGLVSVAVVPFVDQGLGNSSYLIGIGDKRALALDPRRDPTPYLEAARDRGWVIVAALETHLHADFISGGRELAATGSTLYAPAASGLSFTHRPVEGTGEISFGELALRALPTPGHTPEHLAYLVSDEEGPTALFSGGSLLVGSVARTDLIAPEQTEQLTRLLFRSLREQLSPLPDELPVYPTHGSGSFCIAGVSGQRTTTLGAERRHNPFLRIHDEEEFVARMFANLGSYPTYYRHLRERNRRGPAVYGAGIPNLESLTPAKVGRRTAQGAVLVDVRPAVDWAEGHVPGSISIALRDAFASWLGWLIDIDSPLIFVLGPGQDRNDLIRKCLAIGYENLAGELEGGIEAWTAAGLPLSATPRVSFEGINERRLLDVRQRSEWELGHIPGAIHIELGSLVATPIPAGPLAVHCGHGDRATTAASLLERAGRTDVIVAAAGPPEWAAASGRRLTTA